jgi:ubiquinone/menaquinone biosynthesis C-methylase UbiE
LAGGLDSFVPAVLAAAEVAPGYRVLDISTGTGEAALMTLPIVGASGFVIGADISPPMVEAARDRLNESSFCPVAADGQALPFRASSFDSVICQLGLQFFPDSGSGCPNSGASFVLAAARQPASSRPQTGHRWRVSLPT